jgi:hypothetical protein
MRSEVSYLNTKTNEPYYLPCCIPVTVMIPPQIDAGNILDLISVQELFR